MCVSHVIRLSLKTVFHMMSQLQSCLLCPLGLMSPTLAPTAAPALAPALAPAPASAAGQNNLLESSFDALGSLASPTPPVPAAVAAIPKASAAPEPATTTPAPSGGFDASSKWMLLKLSFPSFFHLSNFPFCISCGLWTVWISEKNSESILLV